LGEAQEPEPYSPFDEAQDPHEDPDALDLPLLFTFDVEVGATAWPIHLWGKGNRKVRQWAALGLQCPQTLVQLPI
jgi:hypothetical protein